MRKLPRATCPQCKTRINRHDAVRVESVPVGPYVKKDFHLSCYNEVLRQNAARRGVQF
ncbi:hypothetical protein LCGC14_1878250 [marine sediment metagenome]|uniref:PARP-type domain-containing protein n=1 Tax=marine sediment metagenome TaxID=412755 RepID=A0A0F9G2Z5_9ZZZZ